MKRRKTLASLAGLATTLACPRIGASAVPTEKAPAVIGPDPNTRAPKFKMPPLACDTHTHIFGPDSKYPYSESRTYTPPEAPLEMFKALHDKLRIERCVVVNPRFTASTTALLRMPLRKAAAATAVWLTSMMR